MSKESLLRPAAAPAPQVVLELQPRTRPAPVAGRVLVPELAACSSGAHSANSCHVSGARSGSPAAQSGPCCSRRAAWTGQGSAHCRPRTGSRRQGLAVVVDLDVERRSARPAGRWRRHEYRNHQTSEKTIRSGRPAAGLRGLELLRDLLEFAPAVTRLTLISGNLAGNFPIMAFATAWTARLAGRPGDRGPGSTPL